jgi:arylformamidase
MPGNVIDISQPLRPAVPVWPGDTAFALETVWEIDEQSPVLVSKITMSTHSGTHADAPSHYDSDGADIAACDLTPYIGRCHVVHVDPGDDAVNVSNIGHWLADDPAGVERVLFRTFDTFPHDAWPEGFRAIDPALIRTLAERGCRLIGTDTPSLDPQTSKTLDAHMAVRDTGMAILEGLVLDTVPAGEYELIALPLRIDGADAGPVRAVLRTLP